MPKSGEAENDYGPLTESPDCESCATRLETAAGGAKCRAGLGLSGGGYLAALWVAFGAYLVVVATGAALGRRATRRAIVVAVAAFALAPPLISLDVFSYLSYARLGALHGLNPYGHAPAAIPHDLVIRGSISQFADDQIADTANVTLEKSGYLGLNDHNDTIHRLTIHGGNLATGMGLLKVLA